ncbi:uncharacterized protein LOC129598859 isoform X2 [Paramacrobiotus metropolitanus]|uniref:uncharacterized protein LOC129598859 isoform X2 n=1 Tax=Paramacrobiotus metropolitanus TaxID=2943436 RepID=UPI002445C316|nr:uncharacterized protein LOC129598859 isoform X2 [Paramacrobiotus metropolitanus]
MENMEDSDDVVECRQNGARDCGATVADAENQMALDFSYIGRRNEGVHFGQVHHTPAAVSSCGPATLPNPCSVASGQPEFLRSPLSSVHQMTPMDVRDYRTMVADLEKRLMDREQLLREDEKNEALDEVTKAQSGSVNQLRHLLTLYEGYHEYPESMMACVRTKYRELEHEKCALEASLQSRIAVLEAEISSLHATHSELRTQIEQLTTNSQDEVVVLRRKLAETESLLMAALDCDRSDDESGVVEESGDILEDGINVRKVVVRLVRALKEIQAMRKEIGARKDQVSEINVEIAEFREKLDASSIQRDKLFCTDCLDGSAHREDFAVVEVSGGDQCGTSIGASATKGEKRRNKNTFAKRQKVKDVVVVEVRGGDGVLQCGTVAEGGGTEGGVFVDFRCTGRRNEWVPLDEVFLSRDDRAVPKLCPISSNNNGIQDSVEVLMQHNPSEPWKWQPATALYDWIFWHFGMVVIPLPGGEIRSIIPKDRIRSPSAGKLRGLEEEVELDFVRRMMRFYSKSVLRPLEAENGKATTKGQKRRRCNESVAIVKRLRTARSRSGSLSSLHELVGPEDDGLRFLPVEILMETFQFLHSIDQGRLLAVCSGWYGILTSVLVKRLLQIHFPSKVDFSRARSHSTGSACVADTNAQSCWSNRSAVIVGVSVNGALALEDWPICDGFLLREILQLGNKEVLENLVLKNITCWFQPSHTEDYIPALFNVFNSLAMMCRTLSVMNFICEIRRSWIDASVPITIRIPFGRMRSDRRVTVADWWDMIEQSCPLLDDHQMNLLSTRMNEVKQDWKLGGPWLTITRSRQAGDPRTSSTYFKPFPATSIYPLEFVDVHRLTRMTQYLMFCAITDSTINLELALPA